MSVLTVIWLDCNGCDRERFTPDEPLTSTPRVRELAAAAGWLTDYRRTGKDYGPVCAAGPLTAHKQARGICQGCGTEQVVTLRSLVKLHRRRGHHNVVEACPGGGHAPHSLVRMAAPRGEAWKSLI